MMKTVWCLGFLAAAVPAHAADVISASYDISLGGSRVMKADYTATLDEDNYSADLSAKTVGMTKMFSKIKINMSAKGNLSDAAVKPVSYAYSRKKNDKRRDRSLSFSPSGALVTDGTDYGQAIIASLNNQVMDPLSMLLKLGLSGKPCSGKHRAFDGRDVFDLTLSGGGKSGATLTCKMVYTPVAGNDIDQGDTEPKSYEITLVPYGDKASYMPVRFSGSRKGVGFEVTATSVSVNGAPLNF